MKRSIAVLLLLVVVLPMYAAKKKAAPTEPGKYKEWGDDIDQIEIVKGFKFADYSKIVVEPLDTASTPLPEKDDNTYGPVTAILPVATEKLIEGLREHVKVSVAGGEGAKDAGTLILRGKVTLMDPGSRAARYWASFGAGAARTEIECQIVDAASGDVLVRFKQERRSGFGVGGGSYESVLTRNLKQLGEDVASILGVF
jgi:hypothetical protein